MKKILFGTSLLAVVFSSTSVLANDFSGFRVGGGYSSTSLDIEAISDETSDESVSDFGSGFKIESGYDFNQIVGGNISYETNNKTIEGEDIEGAAIKLSADIGYAFPIQEAFLKPYAKVGLAHYSMKESSDGTGVDFVDDSVFGGLGLRFQYSHFYADVSLDYYVLDLFADYGLSADWKFTQTAFTVGYKF